MFPPQGLVHTTVQRLLCAETLNGFYINTNSGRDSVSGLFWHNMIEFYLKDYFVLTESYVYKNNIMCALQFHFLSDIYMLPFPLIIIYWKKKISQNYADNKLFYLTMWLQALNKTMVCHSNMKIVIQNGEPQLIITFDVYVLQTQSHA